MTETTTDASPGRTTHIAPPVLGADSERIRGWLERDGT